MGSILALPAQPLGDGLDRALPPGAWAPSPSVHACLCALTALSSPLLSQGFQGKTGPPGPPGVVGPQVRLPSGESGPQTLESVYLPFFSFPPSQATALDPWGCGKWWGWDLEHWYGPSVCFLGQFSSSQVSEKRQFPNGDTWRNSYTETQTQSSHLRAHRNLQ